MAHPSIILIESNIPAPSTRHGKSGYVTESLRALARAKVGDSILIPEGAVKRSSIGNLAKQATNGAARWHATAVVEGGLRVWKIAEPKRAVSK